MLCLKMKNLKGLNNDIFDQQSQGYFPDIFRRRFTVVFLINSKKFTIKYMRQAFFVKVTSLSLLKIDSITGIFL